MNNPPAVVCPHCGSTHLVARYRSRKIYIDHNGDRRPVLTVNFTLDRPVVVETATTYYCSCSWRGSPE